MAKDDVIQRLRRIELQLSQTREFHTSDTSTGYWQTIASLDRALSELLDLKIELIDGLKETYRG
jgi:hypothetical protein